MKTLTCRYPKQSINVPQWHAEGSEAYNDAISKEKEVGGNIFNIKVNGFRKMNSIHGKKKHENKGYNNHPCQEKSRFLKKKIWKQTKSA